jgi:hypothetical protein
LAQQVDRLLLLIFVRQGQRLAAGAVGAVDLCPFGEQKLNEGYVTVKGGAVKGCIALRISDIYVGTFLDEQSRNGGPARSQGTVQWRDVTRKGLVLGDGVDVRPFGEEKFRQLALAEEGG